MEDTIRGSCQRVPTTAIPKRQKTTAEEALEAWLLQSLSTTTRKGILAPAAYYGRQSTTAEARSRVAPVDAGIAERLTRSRDFAPDHDEWSTNNDASSALEPKRLSNKEQMRPARKGKRVTSNVAPKYILNLQRKIEAAEERQKKLKQRLQLLSVLSDEDQIYHSLSAMSPIASAALSFPLSLQTVKDCRRALLAQSMDHFNAGRLEEYLSLFHMNSLMVHDQLPLSVVASPASLENLSYPSDSPMAAFPSDWWAPLEVAPDDCKGWDGIRKKWGDYIRCFKWCCVKDLEIRAVDLRGDRFIVSSTFEALTREQPDDAPERTINEDHAPGSGDAQGRHNVLDDDREKELQPQRERQTLRMRFLDFYTFSMENRITLCRVTVRRVESEEGWGAIKDLM